MPECSPVPKPIEERMPSISHQLMSYAHNSSRKSGPPSVPVAPQVGASYRLGIATVDTLYAASNAPARSAAGLVIKDSAVVSRNCNAALANIRETKRGARSKPSPARLASSSARLASTAFLITAARPALGPRDEVGSVPGVARARLGDLAARSRTRLASTQRHRAHVSHRTAAVRHSGLGMRSKPFELANNGSHHPTAVGDGARTP